MDVGSGGCWVSIRYNLCQPRFLETIMLSCLEASPIYSELTSLLSIWNGPRYGPLMEESRKHSLKLFPVFCRSDEDSC